MCVCCDQIVPKPDLIYSVQQQLTAGSHKTAGLWQVLPELLILVYGYLVFAFLPWWTAFLRKP